jgi:hypothetical protein
MNSRAPEGSEVSIHHSTPNGGFGLPIGGGLVHPKDAKDAKEQ